MIPKNDRNDIYISFAQIISLIDKRDIMGYFESNR